MSQISAVWSNIDRYRKNKILGLIKRREFEKSLPGNRIRLSGAIRLY